MHISSADKKEKPWFLKALKTRRNPFFDKTVRKTGFIHLVPVAGLEPARHRWRWILSPLRLPIPSHRRYRDIISHGKRNSKYFLPFPGQKPVIPRCGSYRTDAWTAAPATRPCFRSAPGYPPERPDASARSSRSRGCRIRSGGHTRSAHSPPGR